MERTVIGIVVIVAAVVLLGIIAVGAVLLFLYFGKSKDKRRND